MQPPSAAIFFMTYLNAVRGAWPPRQTPWIRYWVKITFALCSLSFLFSCFVIDSFNHLNYLNSARTRGVLVLLKFTERQILWSLYSVDFHTLTLQLPIQTLHSVTPELLFCEFTSKLSKFQEYEHTQSSMIEGYWKLFYMYVTLSLTLFCIMVMMADSDSVGKEPQ